MCRSGCKTKCASTCRLSKTAKVSKAIYLVVLSCHALMCKSLAHAIKCFGLCRHQISSEEKQKTSEAAAEPAVHIAAAEPTVLAAAAEPAAATAVSTNDAGK